jgi:ubiquinone biosynthesis protein COQ4
MGALNSMGRKYHEVVANLNFFQVIKDPRNTEAIFRMNEAFKHSRTPEFIEKLLEHVYANPKIETAYQEHYWPEVPSFSELETFPEGSFGHELSLFIKKYGLVEDFYPAAKMESRQDYLLSRIYQSHDAWHVLTGYDTSVEQELALQAFGVGQYGQALSALIISGGLIHLLKEHPEKSQEYLGLIVQGFERGERARKLLAEPVLERLREPLALVRQDLNIR